MPDPTTPEYGIEETLGVLTRLVRTKCDRCCDGVPGDEDYYGYPACDKQDDCLVRASRQALDRLTTENTKPEEAPLPTDFDGEKILTPVAFFDLCADADSRHAYLVLWAYALKQQESKPKESQVEIARLRTMLDEALTWLEDSEKVSARSRAAQMRAALNHQDSR